MGKYVFQQDKKNSNALASQGTVHEFSLFCNPGNMQLESISANCLSLLILLYSAEQFTVL